MKFSEALSQAEQWIDRISGVEGVAEGLNEEEPCITVFVSSNTAANQLPASVGPWKVIIEGAHSQRK